MSGDVSLSTAKSGTVGAEFGAGLPDLPVKRGPAIAFMIIDDTVIMETATAPWPQPGSASARAADPLIRVTTELAVAAVVGVSVAANILCQHADYAASCGGTQAERRRIRSSKVISPRL
jgi:hypothetical protein